MPHLILIMTLPEDYRLIRERAALGELMSRGRVAVSGKDRAAYLQGLLTNDIQQLQPGSGCYAAWLTPQGRMTTDMHVLESGDMILLDVPAAQVESIVKRLEQFIFTEDVQVGDLSAALGGVSVHGPQAGPAVERAFNQALGVAGWPDYRNARAEFAGEAIVLARIDRLGVPGFVAYISSGRTEDLRRALIDAGAQEAGAEAIDVCRIEAGYPLFGSDMDDETIPLEAGIESRAISFSKGCYVGQEVVIRVLHRGHGKVARKLVGLRFEADRSVTPGTKLQVDRRDIGVVTSGAHSPRLGAVALGYVHRDYIAPGSRVEAMLDGAAVPGTVSALPFG